MTYAPQALSDAELDVVCVGNALMDHLAFADHGVLSEAGLEPGGMVLVDIATTERIEQLVGLGEQVPGGTVTNTAVGVASFGGRPAFIGAVATDERGERYAEDLERAGVHAVLERFPAGVDGDLGATGRCFIVVTPDAERSMATALGASGRLDRSSLDESVIGRARLAYLDGYLLDVPDADALVDSLVAVARRGGTRIAVGLSDALLVDRHRDRLSALLAGAVDVMFANEAEVLALTGEATVEAAIEALRRPGLTNVVTCGPSGAWLADEDRTVKVPASPVGSVVDLTGAGDLFAAGVCFGMTRGFPLERCGALGALAAAEVIGQLGARTGRPLADEARSLGLL